MLPKRKGFTLIELLIVIVIIGILATVMISAYWRVKNRGFEAAMQQDLRVAATQQETYFNVHYQYAASPDDLPEFEPTPGVQLTFDYAANDGWAGSATHISVPDRHCGLIVGGAPVASGAPATEPGVLQCADR